MEGFKNTFEQGPEVIFQQATPEEIKQVETSIHYSQQLKTINDILGLFEYPDQPEDQYRESLKQLPEAELQQLKQQDKATIEQKLKLLPIPIPNETAELATQSPSLEEGSLIEAQIQELEAKGLDKLTDEEFLTYSRLTDNLLSTENQQQNHQQQLITDEKSETESQKEEIMAELKAQNSKLDELRGSLLSNLALRSNGKIQTLQTMFE